MPNCRSQTRGRPSHYLPRLAHKEVIDGLQIMDMRTRHSLKQTKLTPVLAVPSAVVGLFTIISKIPFGKFVNVADHDHTDDGVTAKVDATGFVTAAHPIEPVSSVGWPPVPEESC